MKKVIPLIFLTLVTACMPPLPPVDDMHGPLPLEVTSPADLSVYELREEIPIRWKVKAEPECSIRIELMKGETLLEVIAGSTENDGFYNWKNTEHPMDENYRFRLTIQDSILEGQQQKSGRFSLKESWEDLELASEGPGWGASVALDDQGQIYVLYQEHNQCLTVKKYIPPLGDSGKGTWMDLAMEDNTDTYMGNYFSMTLGSDGEPLVAYTRNIDHSIVKRKLPGQDGWHSSSFLTSGCLPFGLSLACGKEGSLYTSFSTLIHRDTGNIIPPPLEDTTGNHVASLRSRNRSTAIWYEGDPWADKGSWPNESGWIDEGEIPHVNKAFGDTLKTLNLDYWSAKVIQPISKLLGMPIKNSSRINLQGLALLIISLQPDFYSSIVLDKRDTPYIAYVDGSAIARGVFVTRKIDGKWEDKVGGRVSEGNSNMVSIAFTVEDVPVVAYKNLGANPVTKVKRLGGLGWEDLNLENDPENSYPSLGTDQWGRIFIAAGQTVKMWDRGQWHLIGIPVRKGGGFHPQWLAVNSSIVNNSNVTTLVVAYVDGENRNRIRVKRKVLEW